jgi:hypothetical protein
MRHSRLLVLTALLITAQAGVLACRALPGEAPPATALPSPGGANAASGAADCPIFPPDNIWNTRVDRLPRHPLSDSYIDAIGRDEPFHADFGAGIWPPDTGGPIGIPVTLVDDQVPPVVVTFEYADESDPGPYPIPPDAAIEGGLNSDGDRHILLLDSDICRLYELYRAFPLEDGSWTAGSGAIFDLRGNALRPSGWTSADAAGLPIYPGLARFDEVMTGEIAHALRFTAPQTQRAYVWPARHFASDLTDPRYPPMGQRFRLRADFDLAPYDPVVQVILRAMQRYGIILADNGSPWFISGLPDERWNNDVLRQLRELRGDDFEAVDVSGLMADPDSGVVLVRSAAVYLATLIAPTND